MTTVLELIFLIAAAVGAASVALLVAAAMRGLFHWHRHP
jgi:hypothetical protein